jgi:glycerophosphoryl diester phosphodiesterase
VALFPVPIGFAHRGARAHAPENTLEAFQLALRLGATGLESDVWITADGYPVLDHDGVVKGLLRKRLISEVNRRDLPDHIPGLDDLYATCGTGFALSLDVKDPAAYDATVAVARSTGGSALEKLWLCDPQWERLASLRAKFPDIKMVDSTRLKRLNGAPEKRGAELRAAGIDAINMHYSDWTGGLTTLFARFELQCFGWDAQHERVLRELIAMRIDGVYCDDPERMMSVLNGTPPVAPSITNP